VQTQSQSIAGLPAGVTRSEAEELTVPPGWVVLQAADPSTYRAANFGDPSAQFHVLKDAPALSGDGITRPQESRAGAGQPDIVFGFTVEGGAAFQEFTRVVAERGEQVSGIGQQLNQHFAMVVDDQLVTVPFISFKQYPEGIEPGNGADIVGGFTIESARDLATILRYGVLPVRLTATG
jgi:preprotein translocase subunit SecD